MEPIRVILADDHALVRAGLKAVLESARDIEVVGEARDGSEAVGLAERLTPDVVVMDLTMPGTGGAAATRQIRAPHRRDGRGPHVLVLTMHAEEEYLVPTMEAGAAGYLVKSAVERDLVAAVRTVARGETYVRPGAARILAQGIRKRDEYAEERARYDRLTDREQSVLRLVAHGLSASEIGAELGISPKTVDSYKQRIGEKLGLTHRTDYIRFALKIGLLTEQSASSARPPSESEARG